MSEGSKTGEGKPGATEVSGSSLPSPWALPSPRVAQACSIREKPEVSRGENLPEEGACESGRTRLRLAKEAGGGVGINKLSQILENRH